MLMTFRRSSSLEVNEAEYVQSVAMPTKATLLVLGHGKSSSVMKGFPEDCGDRGANRSHV
jgi:hypothetical protein